MKKKLVTLLLFLSLSFSLTSCTEDEVAATGWIAANLIFLATADYHDRIDLSLIHI